MAKLHYQKNHENFFVDHITKCGEISLGEGYLVQTHLDSTYLNGPRGNDLQLYLNSSKTRSPYYFDYYA